MTEYFVRKSHSAKAVEVGVPLPGVRNAPGTGDTFGEGDLSVDIERGIGQGTGSLLVGVRRGCVSLRPTDLRGASRIAGVLGL